MGKRDNISKAFLADNYRFADLCNYYLFDGMPDVRPEELIEQDTTELIEAVSSAELAFGVDKKSLSVKSLILTSFELHSARYWRLSSMRPMKKQ